MKTFLKRRWKFLLDVIRWSPIAVGIIVFILLLYSLSWTGFGDYTTPAGEFVRGKTLWDWMELLIIPIFLALGAFAVNRSEKQLELQRAEERARLERELATDRQREAALQSYLDRMADLLLKEKLRTTKNEEVRQVARTWTLTVLRGLSPRRKGNVIIFLQEAKLINAPDPIVELWGADLQYVDLQRADLKNIVLRGVDLQNANLDFAGLQSADVRHANLQGASMFGANLSEANLKYAIVSAEQLATVKSFEGAAIPEGVMQKLP